MIVREINKGLKIIMETKDYLRRIIVIMKPMGNINHKRFSSAKKCSCLIFE